MENRIQINGVWYVREYTTYPIYPIVEEVKFDKEEVTHTKSCVYETDKYCWEASILVEETFDNTVNNLLTIKFTDKRTDPWKEDYWDSMVWLEGMLEDNPESLKGLNGVMDEEGIKIFQKFLEYLKNNLGWL